MPKNNFSDFSPSVGKIIKLNSGDVTQLNSITNQPPRVLEKRIGFKRNRLSQGWYVLQLLGKVNSGEFVYGGTTSFSGGFDPNTVVEFDGGLYRIHAQDILRNRYYDKTGSETQTDISFDNFLRNQLTLLNDRKSYNRIVKVLPIVRHDEKKPSHIQYPDAPHTGGIKQWTLTKSKDFLVVARIPPGYIYGGGGAPNIFK